MDQALVCIVATVVVVVFCFLLQAARLEALGKNLSALGVAAAGMMQGFDRDMEKAAEWEGGRVKELLNRVRAPWEQWFMQVTKLCHGR